MATIETCCCSSCGSLGEIDAMHKLEDEYMCAQCYGEHIFNLKDSIAEEEYLQELRYWKVL